MLIPNSKAQSPYIGANVNDLNWAIQTSLSDEFNSGPLDAGKWCVLQNCNGGGSCACYNWGGNSNYTSSNVSFSNGALNFKIDAPVGSPPYDYLHCCNTGGIQSNNESFSYGYMEINAVLPGFIDGSGDAHGDKFTPNFWTYHEEFNPPPDNCMNVHNEIDILEPNGIQYMYADSNIVGVWHETTDTTKLHYAPPKPGCTVGTYKVPGKVVSSSPLCSAYHKFAAEWNTDRMVYYLDDVPFFVSNDAGNVMDPMRLIIAQSLNIWVYDFYAGQPFPDTMKVDYFHYYKLRLDCGNNLTILNNTDLGNYWVSGVPAVKSNITFGNGANTISLSSGTSYIFRAVNNITINGEFTVPSGAELTLMPTPCN